MGGMNFSNFSKGLKNTKTLATTDNENLSLGAFFRLPARSLVVDIRVVINMTFESMTQLQTMGINRTTSSHPWHTANSVGSYTLPKNPWA